MNRSFLERLPIMATALLLAGKMQSGTAVDTQKEDDIRLETQEAAMDAIAEIRALPYERDVLSFEPANLTPGQREGLDSPPRQPVVLEEQPFLPNRERKGRKPKREDFDSSCPPPPPRLEAFDLDRFFPSGTSNITMHTEYS